MKLQRLKVFESISRHLNVTAAAEDLHLSQPAASLQLKLLEAEFGLSLFKRKSNGMELTEEGREFLEAIRPILLGIEAVESKFKACNHRRFTECTRTATPDVVMVGSNHTLLESVFSDVLLRFKECARPEAQLVLEVGGSNSIENLVEEFRLDVALISNPRHLSNCEYEAFRETKYEVAVVAAADSQVGRRPRPRMSLEELLQQTLVVRTGSTCVNELRRRGYELKSAIQCRTPEAAKLAISQGLGIGLLLKSWVQSEIDSGEMTPIAVPEIGDLTYQSFITWNKRRTLSSHAQRFISTMREMKGVRLSA